MSAGRPPSTVSVALVAVADTAPAVLYSLFEVLASVGGAWEELTGKPAGRTRLRPHVVADATGLVRCAMGAPLSADADFDTAGRYDLVIASDVNVAPGLDPRGRWQAAARWLRARHDDGATIASVCTGSLLLAEAGILDGLEATTHWAAVPLFRQFYPAVRLRHEKVLALAGDGQRVITAGGAGSWAELALYLVGRLCGPAEAVRTSKVFLLGDRSEGQLPFAAMTRPRGHADAVVERCQAWIAAHYEAATPVARMVAQSGLAPRTFKRRFVAATGYTPIEYVQTLRVEEAKQLLEATDLPTDEVGAMVGYEHPASFRRLFRRMTGVSPARYRQRIRRLSGG